MKVRAPLYSTTISCIFLLILVGCKPQSQEELVKSWAESYKFELGTESMANFLNEYQKRFDLSARSNMLGRSFLKRKKFLRRAAYHLYVGDTKKALEMAHAIDRKALNESDQNELDKFLAISYMRLGEQVNCIERHNQYSCIMPLREGGLHTYLDGSGQAIELYKEILKKNPDDLESRWLINVAYMTLGMYPGQVPSQYLVPIPNYTNIDSNPIFIDIAPELNINELSLSGSVIIDAFNNDGHLDLIVSSWMVEGQLSYFVNTGKGTFKNHTEEAGLSNLSGGLSLSQADFNNDGHLDFLIMRGAWQRNMGYIPNSLLLNNGDNTFEDVTVEAGILSLFPSQVAAFVDLDNDGWLDIIMAIESSPRGFQGEQIKLYRNQRDGTFEDEEIEIEGEISPNLMFKGIAIGDYDNDGLTDVYLSAIRGNNVLLQNTSTLESQTIHFKNVSTSSNIEAPFNSFPTWFWDYNNDGLLDIFVADFELSGNTTQEVTKYYLGLPTESRPSLYKNLGDGHFQDVGLKLGLDRPTFSMGSDFGDMDNDGYLDVYLGTGAPNFEAIYPNLMYRNDAGTRFENISMSSGTAHLQKGHGIAFGDFDNDGDQDLFAEMGGAFIGDAYQNSFFENQGSDNSWITLQLQGVTSNRSAIGTRIKIVITEEGKQREIHRQISSGGSFGGSSLQAEIGLGSAEMVDTIQIFWPASKTTQILTNIPARQILKIKETDKF